MLKLKRAAAMATITAFTLGGLALATSPAQAADMMKVKVCNKTSSTLYASVGGWDKNDSWYSSPQTIKVNECNTPGIKYKTYTVVTVKYGVRANDLNKEKQHSVSDSGALNKIDLY